MIIVELMDRGGWMMWVILGISVVATVVFLDRFFTLYVRSSFNMRGFLSRVLRLVETQDYRQALETCNVRTAHPLPKIIKAGISRSNRRDKEIERAMEEEMLRALPSIQRGLGFLALLANSATLLGLLGTIFGLIKAFSSVNAASAAARQQVLAEGISMAMYTTAFGIMVAVPILFAHTMISGRVDRLLIQMEEGASALLGSLAARLKDPKVAS